MAAVRGFSLSNISRVSIVFSSYDARSTSTRELLRRVVSNKMKESNPKCQVAVDIRGDYAKPDIKLKLKNGEDLSIDPSGRTVLDIIAEINSRTKQ